MDAYSSPYTIPNNNSPHTPFPPFPTKNQTGLQVVGLSFLFNRRSALRFQRLQAPRSSSLVGLGFRFLAFRATVGNFRVWGTLDCARKPRGPQSKLTEAYGPGQRSIEAR